MKLQENINRIKEMMGIINEDVISLPIVKSDSYTAPLSNCDRLRAFNDTGSGSVGKMNDIINPILEKIYNSGINPDITDINVEIVRGSEYTVNWSVTIDKSKDGKAYVGLYSRGHGGNGSWVFDNVNTSTGHASIDSCKTSSAIKKRGTVLNIILVKDYEYNKDGKISGCQVNQLFYKYTLKEFPSHKQKPEEKETKFEIDPRYRPEPASTTYVKNEL